MAPLNLPTEKAFHGHLDIFTRESTGGKGVSFLLAQAKACGYMLSDSDLLNYGKTLPDVSAISPFF